MPKILIKALLLIMVISLSSCIKKNPELEDSKKSSIFKRLNGTWIIEPDLSDTFRVQLNDTEDHEGYIDLFESYKGAVVKVAMNKSNGKLQLQTEGIKGKKLLNEDNGKATYSEHQLIEGTSINRVLNFRVMKVGKTYAKVKTDEGEIMYLRTHEGFLVLDRFYHWEKTKQGQNPNIHYKFMFKKRR